ncbi:MAG: hypothetical protein ACRC5M_06980, partial [Anaeroplasmataceae bacterium]
VLLISNQITKVWTINRLSKRLDESQVSWQEDNVTYIGSAIIARIDYDRFILENPEFNFISSFVYPKGSNSVTVAGVHSILIEFIYAESANYEVLNKSITKEFTVEKLVVKANEITSDDIEWASDFVYTGSLQRLLIDLESLQQKFFYISTFYVDSVGVIDVGTYTVQITLICENPNVVFNQLPISKDIYIDYLKIESISNDHFSSLQKYEYNTMSQNLEIDFSKVQSSYFFVESITYLSNSFTLAGLHTIRFVLTVDSNVLLTTKEYLFEIEIEKKYVDLDSNKLEWENAYIYTGEMIEFKINFKEFALNNPDLYFIYDAKYEGNKGTNARKYSVKIFIQYDDLNYRLKTNLFTLIAEILPANISIDNSDISLEKETYYYNGASQVVKINYNKLLSKYKDLVSIIYIENTFGEVGRYEVTFVLTWSSNYRDDTIYSIFVDIEIATVSVDLDFVELSKIYYFNNLDQVVSINYSKLTSNNNFVQGIEYFNNVFKYAGEYTFTIKIKYDSENYILENEIIAIPVTIHKNDIIVTIHDKESVINHQAVKFTAIVSKGSIYSDESDIYNLFSNTLNLSKTGKYLISLNIINENYNIQYNEAYYYVRVATFSDVKSKISQFVVEVGYIYNSTTNDDVVKMIQEFIGPSVEISWYIEPTRVNSTTNTIGNLQGRIRMTIDGESDVLDISLLIHKEVKEVIVKKSNNITIIASVIIGSVALLSAGVLVVYFVKK